jgi:hypothetical protein
MWFHRCPQCNVEINVMADYTKLMADLADLKTMVQALVAKANTPPADEQPQVDAAAQAVEDIKAMIPSA